MKCIKCGGEIKPEFNICPYCGNPVQMVPDYSVYDEDDINVLLEETKDVTSKNNKAYIREQKSKEEQERKKAQKIALIKKERNKKIVILGSCVAAVILVIGIIASIVVSNNNSFEYQIKQADAAMFEEDYSSAEKHYKKAIIIEPENVRVRLKLAEMYIETENNLEAIALLEEVLEKDAQNIEAYKLFYNIYSEENNVEAMYELLDGVTNSKILDIFSDIVVEVPKFDNLTGEYSNRVSISLKAKKGLEIYYTIDGTDPKTHGIKYADKIELEEEGEHVVKAVSKNKDGAYSIVVSETYTIVFEAPADPVVNPDGGTFYDSTYIYITVPEGCIALYTWDRTDPTVYSNLYTAPILIPEGYNVFSVVIMDAKSGLQSSIYRGAFEYITD